MSWTCATCGVDVNTLHCPSCGEKRLEGKDLTFMGLMSQVFQSLSSIDSRLLRSLRVLAMRPGVITSAYLSGPRKPYIGPFQLFLIVNVAFFAVQSFSGSAVFSTSLYSHMHVQDWSAFARELVAHKLQAAHTTLDAYAPVFDHAVDVNAKSLVILLVLPFTLLLIPLFAGSRRPFVTHVVVVIATYLYVATGVVYGATGVVRALKIALLAAVIAAAVPGYRFLIFLVTLYFT